MKSFIRRNHKQIFDTLDGRVIDRLAEILPTRDSFSKYEQDNPFALYCGYLDLVRPLDIESEYAEMAEKVGELQQRLDQQRQEFETAHQVSSMYVEQEQAYKDKISTLDEQLSELQLKYKHDISDLKEELEVLQTKGNKQFLEL